MRKPGLLFLILCSTAAAQWLQVPGKGIPRTKDGKPDLTAPAPRKPDGKPDLGGIWGTASAKYLVNIAADFKPGELPIQPWAEALTKERMTGIHASEESNANCESPGVPRIDNTPNPFKIVQEPDIVVILYEAFGQFRQVFLDGRKLPVDANPTWLGYSVGRWDGDALVVESTGFNGKTWLDQTGHPVTDALHVTERWHRADFGHMDLQFTIDDPKAYTKPWTVTEPMVLLPDTDLIEYVCNENEKDLRHLGKKQESMFESLGSDRAQRPGSRLVPAVIIHDRLSSVTLSPAAIDVPHVRIVDLDVDTGWQPKFKMKGFSNPFYRSGLFEVANGKTVHLYTTGARRLVVLPPKGDGTPVLFEVKEPESFVAQVQREWADRS